MSFERTIEQYRDHFKKYQAANIDSSEAERAKYESRLQSLSEAHKDFASKFAELKEQYNKSDARSQLFSGNDAYAVDGESVVNKRSVPQAMTSSPRSSFDHRAGLPLYNGLEKERSIFQRGNAQLDLILEMGHQSLDDLVEQNQILRKVQDRMSSSLRTLGVSEDTIQMINRRAFKDKFIFYFAFLLMLVGFYFVFKWLR